MRTRPVALVLCLTLGCHFSDKHPFTTIALGTTVLGGGVAFGACLTHDDASTCATTVGIIDAGVLALVGLGFLAAKLGSHDSSSASSGGDDDAPSVYTSGTTSSGDDSGGDSSGGDSSGGDSSGGDSSGGDSSGGDSGGGGTITVDPGAGHTDDPPPPRDPNGCDAKRAEEQACHAEAARKREACNATIDACKSGCIDRNGTCLKGTNNAAQIKACGDALGACLSACNDSCKPEPCPHYTECIGGQTPAE